MLFVVNMTRTVRSQLLLKVCLSFVLTFDSDGGMWVYNVWGHSWFKYWLPLRYSFFLKIDPQILHNHADSSVVGTLDTVSTHTNTRTHIHNNEAPKLRASASTGVFWLQPSWSSSKILIEKLMQKNQLASSFVSNRLLKASSEQQSMLSTWVAPKPLHSFVYVFIAGGFRYMNLNEININEFSTFCHPLWCTMYIPGYEIMSLVST